MTSLRTYPPPIPPARPQNAAHEVANGINTVIAAPFAPVNLLNEGFASLTASVAAALPAFPAATLTSLAMGLPHAHVAHPPSGPPPVPPTPLPPVGQVLFGTCVSVLINGKPAARSGDMGINPTCCGLPPLFEVVTGSSKVFIGGARAARSLDITYHCKPVPPAGAAARGTAAAMQAAMKAMMIGGMAAQAIGIAADTAEAVDADDAAMSAALGMSATVAAAQMANDAVAMAMGLVMGKDPCVPPGTPGAIAVGSPNVLIGGFPMPSWMAIAHGLLKVVKGLRRRARNRQRQNKPCAVEGQPIDLVTGACTENFVDARLGGRPPLLWRRWYDSRWSDQGGPLGPGYRHEYQRELRRTLDGVEYTDAEGETVAFPGLDAPGASAVCGGYRLTRGAADRYTLERLAGAAMTFEFAPDATAAPLARIDDGGAWLAFGYDAGGRLASVIASDGRAVRVASDVAGRITQLALAARGPEPARVLAAYRYDAAGRLAQFTDALGQSATYAYDAAHRMVRRTDRRGYTFHNEYDAEGRCVREYGEDGLADCRVQYLPGKAVATYADGSTTAVAYDDNQVVTEVVEPSGGRKRFEVDADGNVVRMLDPLGNPTTHLYDVWGGHVGRQTPHGHVLPPLNDDPNPPDPLAYRLPRTPLAWEHGGLLDPAAVGALDAHDPVLRAAAPELARAILDADGAHGHAHEHAHAHAHGNVVHDPLGRVVEEVDERGYRRRWAYDGEGNVLAYEDRDGVVTRSAYKSWNLLAERADPAGGVRFDYSLRSAVTRFVDANGNASEYAYDAWDRLTEVRRGGGVVERYRYDVADNLVAKEDGDGRPLLTFSVLPGNLHGERRLASGEAQRFAYDAAGRITAAATDELHTAFAYDAAGRRVGDLRDGAGVAHEFAEGRLRSTRYLGRYVVRYGYSGAATRTVTDPTGAAHVVRVSPGGGLVTRALANGTTEIMRYDRAGRCTHKAATGRGRGLRWRYAYGYSGEGDLLWAVGPGAARREFRYEAHRLRREALADGTAREYRHDPAGNLVAQPGLADVVVGDGNRLRAANGEAFAYTRRNAVGERAGPRGRVRYEYDSLDRLVACDVDGEPWTAAYDPLGRRVRKTWRGATTRYYWDGFRLAAELRDDGPLRLYVYADEAALVPFMFVDYARADAEPADGAAYFVFTDQIGAPVRVEDAAGAVAWRAQVDPYGRARVAPGGRVDMPLRFPGHYHDAETGLHYNRFRYYDPVLGRYLQSDPLGIRGGPNLYAYAPNPLTAVDLDGLSHNGGQGNGSETGPRPEGPNREGTATAGGGPPGGGGNEPSAFPGLTRGGPADAHAANAVDALHGGAVRDRVAREYDANTERQAGRKRNPAEQERIRQERAAGRDAAVDQHYNREQGRRASSGEGYDPKDRSVTVIEHANEQGETTAVSVGLSGRDPGRREETQRLVNDMNEREVANGRPPIYRAADSDVPTAGLGRPPADVPAPDRGFCSEPAAAHAAGQQAEPPRSYQTVWSGPGDPPDQHRLTPPQSAGPGGPEQMRPCPTCQLNADRYGQMANGGGSGAGNPG